MSQIGSGDNGLWAGKNNMHMNNCLAERFLSLAISHVLERKGRTVHNALIYRLRMI